MNVQQLSKTLTEAPQSIVCEGIRVRNFSGSQDIDIWIDVQRDAFRASKPAARPWSRSEFTKRLLGQPWWSPARMWFAEHSESPAVVGTVTLAMRSGQSGTRPVVHWLAVVPKWRRLGIARLLMSELECYCWDHELRDIGLETHKGWREAAALYETLGYS